MKNYKNFIIHEFEELESTNSYALNLARNAQIFEREIIVANLQNAGRGRMDRAWESPKGNLYFSLILQPKVSLSKIPQISFIAAAALRKALEGVNEKGFLIQNKWPNDILINGKKVAGILLESETRGGELSVVVLGVGVNILSNPQNTIFPATNLGEFEVEISPQKLLEKFLDEFEIFYRNWLEFGFAGVRNYWLQGGFCLEKEVKVSLGGEVLIGIFEDVDLDGSLVLRRGGEVFKVFYGDVC